MGECNGFVKAGGVVPLTRASSLRANRCCRSPGTGPPSMSSPGRGERFDPLGRQVNVAARATRGLLDAVLAESGTTFSGWTVLAALSAEGPIIQKDLAQSLDMIGPSIVERIDQLESAGLVARSSVPEDRRASLVSLTDEGRALFGQLREVMRQTEAALLQGLDPDDVQIARRVLGHVADQARALRGGRSPT
jgi:MarR family transcriptional regulator, transcriptional regulator for hemolysin